MPHVPDPNPSTPNPSGFHSSDASVPSDSLPSGLTFSLEGGLGALNAKNYPEAIAHLEVVYHHAERRSVRLKAQMALVKAYGGNGQYEQAVICCQTLLNSSSEPVRQWAKQAIAILRKRRAEAQTPLGNTDEDTQKLANEESQNPSTPFYTEASTLVDPLAIENPTAPVSPPSTDPTGFTPLEEPATPASARTSHPTQPHPLQPSADSTGFVPIVPGTSSSPHSEPNDHDLQPPRADVNEAISPQRDEVWDEPSKGASAQPSGLQDNSSTDDPDDVMGNNPFVFDLDAPSEGPRNVPEPLGGDHAVQSTAEHGTPNPSEARPSLHPRRSPPPSQPQPVDPELAAALNISKPRRGTQKSSPPLGSSPPEVPPERAKQWTPLKRIRQMEFWLSYGWTAIALVALFTIVIKIALATADPVWQRIIRYIYLSRWQLLDNHPSGIVIIVLVVMLGVSQWLLRLMLGWFYGVKPLPDRELERRSPETMRILKRVCKQQGFPVPQIGLLPGQAPVIFSYGILPRTSRIVMSQGMLTQLADDEMATLVAAELGHMQQRDTLPVMLVTVMAQIPFLIYTQVAQWGDRHRNSIVRALAAGIAAIAYGMYWIIRWPGLWVSRTRQFQGDRHAVNITGNPNGMALALVKMASGIAQDIERQRSTHFMLEGMSLLMPMSVQQVLTLGSVYARQVQEISQTSREGASASNTLASLLAWDVRNPHRQWLTINNSHPTLGDRIKTLNQYGQQFRLRPSIPLWVQSGSGPTTPSKPFWLQISPYVGAPLGMTLAIALWLVGGIAELMNVDELEWLWKDTSLLFGFIAIGFSFGSLMRINGFFPDISTSTATPTAQLPDLLADPSAIPLNSVPIQFEGRLLGRSGIENGLCQDLMLRTDKGTIKLHWISPIGPAGNLFIGKVHPSDLIGRTVSVTGWFRRGATPWVDAEKIRLDHRTVAYSSHPLWSTLVAIAVTLWGVYVIYRGTL